jgi:glycosyltransferase involved in cell wall biosynthesis
MTQQLGPGGTERQLAESAMMLDRKRFQPWVAYMRTGFLRDELARAGVGLIELPVTSFLSPSLLRESWHLRSHLRQKRIQLVHTFDYPMTILGVPTARFARVPVVLSSQRAHRDLVPKRFRRILRWTDSQVDGIVVNCEAMREHMTKDENASPSRLHVCYNAMDLERFPETPRNPGSENVTIGVICQLRPEKNVAVLLDAFQRLSHPTATLVIVGGGPNLPVLRQQAEQLGLGMRVHFEPATPNVPEWLARLDIFVLPSLSEAFSNSLMEAMSTGAACVASEVGGNPELVSPEQTGLLFPPGDADVLAAHLDRLIREPQLRQRLGGSAAEYIRSRFSRHVAAERLMRIYEDALAVRYTKKGKLTSNKP